MAEQRLPEVLERRHLIEQLRLVDRPRNPDDLLPVSWFVGWLVGRSIDIDYLIKNKKPITINALQKGNREEAVVASELRSVTFSFLSSSIIK